MFDAARSIVPDFFGDSAQPLELESPTAEISGTDDMYIPTTQIRLAVQPRDSSGRATSLPFSVGPWHRRSAIANETACGIEYAACMSREYELEGELCPDCFTKRELELAVNPDAIPDPGRKKT